MTYPTFRSDRLSLPGQSFTDRLIAPETTPDKRIRQGEDGKRNDVVDQQQSHVITTSQYVPNITFR